MPSLAPFDAGAAGAFGRPAPVKLILKVKDDPLMTADWIEHHAAIVGYGNLAVFDNGSTSPEQDLVTARYAGRMAFFANDTFVDAIHDPRCFPGLYALLARICGHYAVLDADERLVWLEEDRWIADDRILGLLARQAAGRSVLGTWLPNLLGHADAFAVGARQLRAGLDWGKTLISTATMPSGSHAHNIQSLAAGTQAADLRNLFVLHLSLLAPQQRIAANLRKLQAFGVLPPDMQVDAAVRVDSATLQSVKLRQYLDEMKRLHAHPPGYRDPLAGNPAVLRLRPGGGIAFADDAQRALLQDFLGRTGAFATDAPPATAP